MNDKDNKKALKNQYKQKQSEVFQQSLPMSATLFEQLFGFLDENIDEGTGTNFTLTQQFCDENGIDFEPLRNWLIENGAGDDSEVLLNVEEQFG